MSAQVNYKEILFGWVGGLRATDPDFNYDPTTQTLSVVNMSITTLETVVNETITGDTTIWDAAWDTLTLNALTTVATTQKIQFRDTWIHISSQNDW